jgi:hypothetical protein
MVSNHLHVFWIKCYYSIFCCTSQSPLEARDKRPAILYAILLAYSKLHRFLLHVVISNPVIQVQPEYPEAVF